MSFLALFRDWEDVEEYHAGTVIFSEQDPADVMYVIMAGEIELTLHGKPLGVEGEAGIIGEMAVIASATCSATAKTLTQVRLARLDQDQIKIFIDEHTEFASHVMAVMANRLRAVDKFITTQFTQIR